MNNLCKITLLFVLLTVISSCGSLKKSQVKLVGDFYNSISNYPTHVRQLNERVAKLELESQNLGSALQPSDSMRVRTIIVALTAFENDLRLPDSVRRNIEIVDQYIKGYYAYIPKGYDIYKTFKIASETIGGMFGIKWIFHFSARPHSKSDQCA